MRAAIAKHDVTYYPLDCMVVNTKRPGLRRTETTHANITQQKHTSCTRTDYFTAETGGLAPGFGDTPVF